MSQIVTSLNRKLNTSTFSNVDTLSKSQLESLISKGQVEVFTPSGLKDFIQKSADLLEKSEDSNKIELEKALAAEISTLTTHRVEGNIFYLRPKKSTSDDIQKSEEIKILEISDIIKSQISDCFTYGSLSKVQFPKKGSEIKEGVTKRITQIQAEQADLQTKMTTLTDTLPIQPADPFSDYVYSGMKDKITPIFRYPWSLTCYRDNQQPSYDQTGPEAQVATSQSEAQMYDMYNMLAEQYISRSVDICYLNAFLNNLKDGTTYQMSLPELMSLGVENGDHIEKSELDNNIEKGGEGSKGGKIIGHTKSGKAIYASKHAAAESKYDSKDHDDAAYAHLDHAEKLAKQGKKDQADNHSDHFDRHMEAKKTKKVHEDLAKEDKK